MTCKYCKQFKRTDKFSGYCKNTLGNKPVDQNFSCPFFAKTAQPSVIPKHLSQPTPEQFEPAEPNPLVVNLPKPMETGNKSNRYSDEEPKPKLALVEPLDKPKELPSGNKQKEM